MQSKIKDNILLTASHLYLFWTTGVYYLWDLNKRYNVVLFVEDTYNKSDDFLNLCKHLKIYKIRFLKMSRPRE